MRIRSDKALKLIAAGICDRNESRNMLSRLRVREDTMDCTRTIATALMLLLLATSSAFAQGAGLEWEILNEEVKELYRTGRIRGR